MRVPPDRRPALAAGLLLLAVLAAVLVAVTPGPPVPTVPEVPVDPDLDFSATEQARSAALAADLEPWQWTGLLAGLAASAVLGLTPLGARWIALAARPLGGGPLARAAVAGLAVTLLVRLARLPAGIPAERLLREAGLSTRSWGGYALDWLRGLGVTAVTLAVAFVLGYALVRRFPRRWWAPVAAVVAGLVVAGSFVHPLLVEPVFFRFTPLAEGPLRSELVTMAERRGLVVEDVLVADASRRTSTLNAYVSGFGSSRRIVLYDTLLAGATDEEVLAVAAHEVAHAAEGDVLVSTLTGALGGAAAVCLAFVVLGPAAPRRRDGVPAPEHVPPGPPPALVRRAGATDIGDPRSAALVLLLLALGALVTAPVVTAVSRRVEARADVAALELTRDPGALVDLQRRLAVVNRADLDPSLADLLLRATHPSAPERIATARRWALLAGLPVPPPRVAAVDAGGPEGGRDVGTAG